MKYTIFLVRHEYGFIEVEANSVDEAKGKALESEQMGEAHWTDADVEISGYEEYKSIQDEDGEIVEVRYYVCGLGYDKNGIITDYERGFGDFYTYEGAYSLFARLRDMDADSLFAKTPNLYQMLIQLEECEETDDYIECTDVKNEYWIVNPNYKEVDEM